MIGHSGTVEMGKKTISICIPVYNESANLPIAVDAVEKLFAGPLSAYGLEIIITDNASTDQTWSVIQELAKTRPNLKAYRFARNFGYQNSVFAGLSLSTGDAVVEMDADLEDPPHIIPQFVEKWEQGFQVAYGVRAKRHTQWMLKLAFALFYRFLNRISDLKIPQDSGDFRLLDRQVVDVLRALPERNLYLRGLVAYLGFRQTAIIYERQPRISGSSKFRMIHYFVLAIDAITAFSKAPLRLIGVLGICLFLISSVLAAYYLVSGLIYGTPVPGFTTLVVLTLGLNSITFIFLGILGEYLSRVFDDSKFRPRVIIAEAANIEKFPPTL